ncbi:MAG: class I SAM-dependent methyltransferase [Thermoleophilaceae bacterium]
MDVVKQRTAESWGLGDYSVLSGMLQPAAVALADACAVSAGQEVLDVAAGDGNFALACAREGAKVVASDLSPGMVERGRARSEREGFEIEWLRADAEELSFDDGRFDCVGSVFGAMIAPRPEVVARELFRVVRPGGTVGMTAWVPGSFTAEMIGIGRKYDPAPPGEHLSEEWGVEETVRERFEGLAGSIRCERSRLVHEGESPQALVESLLSTVPPMVAARQLLPAEHFDALRRDLIELAARFDEGGEGGARIPGEYLLTVARKSG